MSMDKRLMLSRRNLLKGGVFGVGGLLLRGLATGLAPASLLAPKWSLDSKQTVDLTLILSTSSAGDPVNVNCPGSYVDGVTNNPNLTAVDFMLGHRPPGRAKCGRFAQALRDRLAFVHYRTNAVAHTEYGSAMAFHGAVKNSVGNGSEMLPSAIAQMLAPGLGTLQTNPVPLGSEQITVEGSPLQNLKPSELKALFADEASTIANLSVLRDQVLDDLYAELKVSGTRSQRAFLDQYALSRTQARALGDSLGALLEVLPANPDPDIVDGPLDQVITAVALAVGLRQS